MNYIEKEAFTDFAKHLISEYDYIFYIDPAGVEMEDNSVRETNLEYRNLIDFIIHNIVTNNKFRMKNFYSIPPYLSVEERIDFIKKSLWS
jgi:hypothetical protein